MKYHPWLTVRYVVVDYVYHALVFITRNPIVTAKTFFGHKIQVLFPNYRSILHHGLIDSWELPIEDWLMQNLKADDVFFDIGANVGFYSLLAQALGARVYAFEPTPSTFQILQRNAPDVILVPKALMAKEGIIPFSDKGVGVGTNTAHVQGTEPSLITVDATTLDTYCREQSVQPTVLKIDVEGAERETLEGAQHTFSALHPTLIIETKNDETIDFVCSLGYRAFHFPLHVRPEPIAYTKGDTVECPNLLFIPVTS